MAVETLPPPGWFRDRTDQERLRYWDGRSWTQHTARRERPQGGAQPEPVHHPLNADKVGAELLAGERAVAKATLSPQAALLPAVVAVVVGFLLGGLVALASPAVGLLLMAFVWIFSGLFALEALVRLKTSEFVLTDRRIITKVGWLKTSSFELNLSKVEGVGVERHLIGRFLGFGRLVVKGTGGSPTPSPVIVDPSGFRNAVVEQVGVVQAGMLAPQLASSI